LIIISRADMIGHGREGRKSLLNLIEHHEIERRLRKIEDYSARMLAVMLIQARCYDEPVRSQFEDEARRLTSKLAGDSDAIFLLTKLVGGAHLGGFRFAERAVKAQRVEQARIKKLANDLAEQRLVYDAVKQVTDRRGIINKRTGKPPVSDECAKLIRSDVLAVLSRPQDLEQRKKGLKPSKPSVTGIRRALKQIRDGAFCQTDPLFQGVLSG